MPLVYILTAISSFLLILFSLHLFLVQTGNRYLNYLLAIFFFARLVENILYSLILTGFLVHVPILLKLFMPLSLSGPALFYLYISGFFTDRVALHKKDLVHFVPALLAMVSGTTSWEAVSGVSSVGAIGTATSTGATISSGALSLSPADASNPGIVSTSTQTFAGAKTFNSDLIINGITVGIGGGDPSSASYNVAFGLDALVNNTGWGNTAIGRETLTQSANSTNTAVGFTALKVNTNGSNNVAVGARSTSSNTDGNENSALGAYSLNANTTGDYNLALGGCSLYTNTTGIKILQLVTLPMFQVII